MVFVQYQLHKFFVGSIMNIEQMAQVIIDLNPFERADLINKFAFGFDQVIGIVFTICDEENVEAYCDISEVHLQPYGLVHGGVYAGLSESVCSVGAALSVLPKGKNAVGVSNHTVFKKPARKGNRVYVKATLHEQGLGGIHVWKTVITSERGELYAHSTVKVATLDFDKKVGGEKISLQNLQS